MKLVDRGESQTAAQKAAIKQEWTEKYPRAIYRGESTTTYNCHAYAWSVSEGGEKYWMNSPNDAWFCITPNVFKAIRVNVTGYYNVTVMGSITGTPDIHTFSKRLYIQKSTEP